MADPIIERDFTNFLKWLSTKGSIWGPDRIDLEDEIILSKGSGNTLNLAYLLTFLGGSTWARHVISSLPMDIERTAANDLQRASSPATNFFALGEVPHPQSSDELIASEFAAYIVKDAKRWTGIQSISFNIFPPKDHHFVWTFPIRNSSPDQKSTLFNLAHAFEINVRVDWPAYSTKREVHGKYCGVLSHEEEATRSVQPTLSPKAFSLACPHLDEAPFVNEGKELHVVGEWTVRDALSAQYKIEFSDRMYNTDQYMLSVGDMLEIFRSRDFLFTERLKNRNISGLEDAFWVLLNDPKLENPGFVLEKTLPRLFLRRITGDIPINISALGGWPFPANPEFKTLRVVLQDIDSSISRKLLFELNGIISLSECSMKYIPFCLAAGLSPRGTSFEFSLPTGKGGQTVSVAEILQLVHLDTQQVFPSISDLTEKTHISNATVRWAGRGFDYLRLDIGLKLWEIVEDKFVINELSLDIRAMDLSSSSKRHSLQGSGIFTIYDVVLEVTFGIRRSVSAKSRIAVGERSLIMDSHNRSDSEWKMVFQIASKERPLSLDSVLGHFAADVIIPDPFCKVLKETEIDSLVLEGLHRENHWSLSYFGLDMSIRTKLQILDKFALVEPRLVIDIDNPFQSYGRSMSARIISNIRINDVSCIGSIHLTNQNGRSAIELTFKSNERPLSLLDVISGFLGQSTLSVPSGSEFLLSIGLTKAVVTLQSVGGEFSLGKIDVAVASTTRFDVWKGLSLEGLSLSFIYSGGPKPSTNVTFHASLAFTRNMTLDFNFEYCGGSPKSYSDSDRVISVVPPSNPVEASTANGVSWTATATFANPQKVGLLATLSRIWGGSDSPRDSLSHDAKLPRWAFTDISIPDVNMTLKHNAHATSFTLTATSYIEARYTSVDAQLKASCAKSRSTWLYAFRLSVSSDGFLVSLNVGDLGAIRLEKAWIMISNHPNPPHFLDHPDDPVDESASKFSLALSATLTFTNTKSLESLGRLMKPEDRKGIVLSGAVSGDRSFKLCASLKDPISLFDNKMKLSGSLGITYHRPQFKLGITGEIIDGDFPSISKTLLRGTAFLHVALDPPKLDLGFTVEKLTDAFGIKNLDLRDLKFELDIALVGEVPAPTKVKAEGKVDFHPTEGQQYRGSIEIDFDALNLDDSYANGCFITYPQSMSQALRAFDAEHHGPLPEHFDGVFVFLTFDIGRGEGEGGLNRTLKLKGELNLPSPKLTAFFNVTISPHLVHVDGYIKDAVNIYTDPRNKKDLVFALRDDKDPKCGPSVDITIGNTLSKTKVSAYIYFLGFDHTIALDLSDGALKPRSEDQKHGWFTSEGSVDFKMLSNERIHIDACWKMKIFIPEFSIGITIGPIETLRSEVKVEVGIELKNYQWSPKFEVTFWLFEHRIGSVSRHIKAREVKAIEAALKTLVKADFAQLFLDRIRDMIEEDVRDVVYLFYRLDVAALRLAEFLMSLELDVDNIKCIVIDVYNLWGKAREEFLKGLEKLLLTAVEGAAFMGALPFWPVLLLKDL